MWFEELMGFTEENPSQVRQNCCCEDGMLRSLVNGAEYHIGEFELVSLGELRDRTAAPAFDSAIGIQEVVGDVQEMHRDPENEGALFQVASQFNLLEMTGPGVTPERGVGVYQYDKTQGPACAIACGAGTIYRNYFIPVAGQTGQSESYQLDGLAGLGGALGNQNGDLWTMRNGYALPSLEGLLAIQKRLSDASEASLDNYRSLLQFGWHKDTQVTIGGSRHRVGQIYCSALPIAYSEVGSRAVWEPFARLVLEAAYEATIRAALLNCESTGNQNIYLTLLGGGAFGNESSWIIDAIRRALLTVEASGLKVSIVSYGGPRKVVSDLVAEFQQ